MPSDQTLIAPHTAVPAIRQRALSRWLPLLPALLFLPVVLAPPFNHDVAAVLHFSQRWLAGERLYADLIDVNPPLIFVLNLLPATIAAWTPLDGPQSFQLCMIALGALVWFLAQGGRDRDAEGRVERTLTDVLPPLFLLTAGYDFGQREHLMTLCALPYVLASVRRARGERPRHLIATALLAAVGFALKPYFLAVPGLIELAILLARGRAAFRDPAPWTMAAVFAVYLASLPLLFPRYLNSVLPLVYEYYVDLGQLNAFWVLFTDRLGAAVWTVLVPVAWFALRRPGSPRMMLLAGIGVLVSAMVQHKGWSYHVVPVEMFSAAAALLLAARALDAAAFPRSLAAATVLSAVFAGHAVAVGEAPWREIVYPSSTAGRLAAALREHAYGARVLVLTPDIYPVFPAINDADARSTLRTMNLWLTQSTNATCLPDGRRYREVWEMSRAEFFMYRTVAEDAAKAPPSVILVSRNPGIPWCGREFDYIEYFSRHPLFSELWKKYREVAAVDSYRIYVREQ